ncbi:MAG: helix-turn-helix domain-containing protein [Pseudonocardia sp.]
MGEPVFGDELRRLREQRGLSLNKFAKLAHYDPGYLSKVENGLKPPTKALAKACDEVLGSDVRLSALVPPRAASTSSRRTQDGVRLAGDGLSPPTPQSGVQLPVVIDGRHILLPLDAAAVAGRGLALAMNLAPSLGDPSRLETKPANVERAYELYLRGQGLLATNERQRIEAAATLLDRALDIDPRFTRAQAARGYAMWRQYFSGSESEPSTLERALGDVDAVLRLDPHSIGAHTALIRICWDMGWHERALELGRAIYEKNCDSLDATLAFARALNNSGMAETALPLTLAVLEVDPTNPTALKLLVWNHLMIGDFPSALEAARLYLPAYPRDANTRWAVALAHLGSGDVNSAIYAARAAVAADPDDVTAWNLLGYLNRLSGDEVAAHHAWSTGIEHVAARAGRGKRRNLRVQSWLANIEACVGHAERARAAIVRPTEAEPHNGYLKYRLTHVLAELGDAEAAIRMLREAIQDGFLSVQLLRQEERLGLSCLIDLAEYRQVRLVLQQNVDRAKSKYASSP